MARTADMLLERANALLGRRMIAEAEEMFAHAEQSGADPDCCSGGRWMTAMLRGDFETAWRESDRIRARGNPDQHRFWQGEDLAGKRVIVRCLHGFGDAVQFLRYAPRLRSVARSLIVEVPPRMVELARCIRGVDEVITWGDAAPTSAPEWDVQVEVMELPYIFRTTVDQLPIETNYVELPDAELERISSVLGRARGPRVGIVWSCGEWNLSRSIPFEDLKPLLNDRDCEFWNLQGGTVRRQADLLLCDAPDVCDGDLLSLAGVISQMDLVITVDTLTAHLAGALGVPAWVMLRYEADWRWMANREDSPWYPSLRLFREKQRNDWPSVVEEVAGELRHWVAAHFAEEMAA